MRVTEISFMYLPNDYFDTESLILSSNATFSQGCQTVRKVIANLKFEAFYKQDLAKNHTNITLSWA